MHRGLVFDAGSDFFIVFANSFCLLSRFIQLPYKKAQTSREPGSGTKKTAIGGFLWDLCLVPVSFLIKSAINADRLSCYPPGFVADKQLDRIGNVSGFAQSSECVHSAV